MTDTTLEQEIITWGQSLDGAEQTLLTRDREIGSIRERWRDQGGKGNFSRVIRELLERAHAPVPSHPQVQVMLRSAEAQAAGLKVRTRTEAAAAGTLLRKALKDGKPLATAVTEVQELVDQGVATGKAARAQAGEDDGTAPVRVAEVHQALLLEQTDRLCQLARQEGHDAPTEAPDRLGFAAQFLAALSDDLLRGLLRAAREAEGQAA